MSEIHGRELVCNRCEEIVEVFEAPDGWIDEARYVCGRCLEHPPNVQPELQLVPVRRHETPKYDPAQARIPF